MPKLVDEFSAEEISMNPKQCKARAMFDFSRSSAEMREGFDRLEAMFDEKDLGSANKALGIQIHREGGNFAEVMMYIKRSIDILVGNLNAITVLNPNRNRLLNGMIDTLRLIGFLNIGHNGFIENRDDFNGYLSRIYSEFKCLDDDDVVFFPKVCEIERMLFQVDRRLEFGNAITHLFKVLDMSQKVNGKISPQTADVYGEIGQAYMLMGAYDDSLLHYRMSDALWQRIGCDMKKASGITFRIAHVLRLLNKHEEAILTLEKLRLTGEQLDDDNLFLLLNYMAESLIKVGRKTEAIQLLRNALVIKENKDGKSSKQAAICHAKIGKAYHLVPQYQEALDSYSTALDIHIITSGENSMDVASCRVRIANIQFQMKKYQSSLENYQLYETILQNIGADNNMLASIKLASVNSLRGLKRFDETIQILLDTIPLTEENSDERIAVLHFLVEAMMRQKEFDSEKMENFAKGLVDSIESKEIITPAHNKSLKLVENLCKRMSESETFASIMKTVNDIQSKEVNLVEID